MAGIGAARGRWGMAYIHAGFTEKAVGRLYPERLEGPLIAEIVFCGIIPGLLWYTDPHVNIREHASPPSLCLYFLGITNSISPLCFGNIERFVRSFDQKMQTFTTSGKN